MIIVIDGNKSLALYQSIQNPLFKNVPKDFERSTIAKFIQDFPTVFSKANYMEKCILGKYVMEAYEKLLNNIIEQHASNRFPQKRKANNDDLTKETVSQVPCSTSIESTVYGPQILDKEIFLLKSNKNINLIEIYQNIQQRADAQTVHYDLSMGINSMQRLGSEEIMTTAVDMSVESQTSPTTKSIRRISISEIKNFLENEDREFQHYFSKAAAHLFENLKISDPSYLELSHGIPTRQEPLSLPLPAEFSGEKMDSISRYCAQYPLPPPPLSSQTLIQAQHKISLNEQQYIQRFPILKANIQRVPDTSNIATKSKEPAITSFFKSVKMNQSIIEGELDRVFEMRLRFRKIQQIPDKLTDLDSDIQTLNAESDICVLSNLNPRHAVDRGDALIQSGASNIQVVNNKISEIGSKSLDALIPTTVSSFSRYPST